MKSSFNLDKAEALDARSAQAAYSAASAAHSGMHFDAKLWQDRADRLSNMAEDYRRKA